jgi:hypothetical protein
MAKSKADTFEGLGTEAAAPVKRVRASNKEKSVGQILGAIVDAFETMSPEARKLVLATLNAQYPAHPAHRTSGFVPPGMSVSLLANGGQEVPNAE